MDSIKAPFLPRKKIIDIANKLSCQHSLEIPVRVEFILENIGFNIIPLPGLQYELSKFGSQEAFLSISDSGQVEINIDDEISSNIYLNFRGNFTLAHEYGHYVLHQDIFKKIKDINQFAKLYADKHFSETWDEIERQANFFASYFLMPSHWFSVFMNEIFAKNDIEIDSFGPEDKRNLGKYIKSDISKKFEVSESAAHIRVNNFFNYHC